MEKNIFLMENQKRQKKIAIEIFKILKNTKIWQVFEKKFLKKNFEIFLFFPNITCGSSLLLLLFNIQI